MIRAGAKTWIVRVRAVNGPMSPGSIGVTGVTVMPRDQSVTRGDVISPVEW